MPANLTPQYYAAEERFKRAKDDRERLKALKEMLAVMPKHKGTEKLQGDIKRKIARLKEDLQGDGSKKGARRFSFSVEKEGAGQISIVGPPNAGKSQLCNALTNASFEVADYPYTTRMFQPAMMPFEDVQIQLVDLPPLSEEHLENWVPSIIKGSDAALIVLDLSDGSILDKLDVLTSILSHHKIEPVDEFHEDYDSPVTRLKSIFVGNKIDAPAAKDNLSVIEELYGEKYAFIPFSAKEKVNLEKLRHEIIELLEIVRVYSKRPGHPADSENPFVFRRGDTLIDFAKAVHKDFTENLKFARVWSEDKYDGQRINKDYVLSDKDVIELHI